MAKSVPSLGELLLLIWTSWLVAMGMTTFRLTLQWRTHRRLQIGDFLVITGLLSLTTMTVILDKILPHGLLMTRYILDVAANPSTPLPLPKEEMDRRTVMSMKLMFSLMPFFWTTVWAAKFSILFFIRLLLTGLPSYMKWWRACFATVVLLYLACFISHFVTCLPLERNWALTGCSTPEDFVREDISLRFATGADILADLLTMILPLHLLRNLTINIWQKLWLVIIFSLSGIIISIAIVRLIQVSEATQGPERDLLAAVNGLTLLCMWSQIESTVAIVVATLPAFRFLNKNRPIKNITPNSYGLVTIGGTGRSRPRAWDHETGSGDWSHTELGPEPLKSPHVSESDLGRVATGPSTRPGTEMSEEIRSVRRCI